MLLDADGCISSPLTFCACGGRELIYSTQGQCNICITMVCPPQVSLNSHLLTITKGRMNTWVSCASAVQARIEIQTRRFVVRNANHCIMEVHCLK